MRDIHRLLIFKHSHFWLRLTCTTNLFGFILCIDRFSLFQATINWCAPVKSRQLFTQNQSYCHILRKKKKNYQPIECNVAVRQRIQNQIERRQREREREKKTCLSTHYVLCPYNTQYTIRNDKYHFNGCWSVSQNLCRDHSFRLPAIIMLTFLAFIAKE